MTPQCVTSCSYRLLAVLCVVGCCPRMAFAQSGACCVTGGGVIQCFEVTQEECAAFGGVFHGAGSSCAPFLCNSAPTGACCAADGVSCFTSTQENCVNSGGTFHPNVLCSPFLCASGDAGACCLPPIFGAPPCIIGTEQDCESVGGIFQGVGTDCDPFPCDLPPTGACCLEDVQFCFESDATNCAIFEGKFHEGLTCADLECGKPPPPPPTVGACCLLSPFGMSCVEASEASCTSSGGEYQGDDTSCNALTCDPGTGPIGACCIVGGGAIICSVLHQSHCDQLGGTFQGEGAVCDPNPCLNGDCDSDGDVDVDDLLGVISAWGPCPAAKKSCPEDLDGSGEVDTDDLLLVIYNWGGN